jgi:hypothetical protein
MASYTLGLVPEANVVRIAPGEEARAAARAAAEIRVLEQMRHRADMALFLVPWIA